MFTGIIQSTASVGSLDRNEAGARLVLEDVAFATDLETGESVAVNGCCLTVTPDSGARVGFDILGETLRATNLGELETGSTVNLERALRAGDRMSGHYVQGHVDCTATVLALDPSGNDHRFEIALPPEYAQYIAYKGSVAINGISLTVAEVGESSFTTWIIPHTLAATNLGTIERGDEVNLEFDILAKYVERIAAVTAR